MNRLTSVLFVVLVGACSPPKTGDSYSYADSGDPASTTPEVSAKPTVVVPLGPQLEVRDGIYDPHKQPRHSPEWIDVDGDCQGTDTEVLIARATGEVKFTNKNKCKVTSGAWDCFLSQKRMTSPKDLLVVPLVPYANAHASGASQWEEAQQRDFMNDAESLIIAERDSVRSRGDYGPDVWLPLKASVRCAYLTKWLEIKNRWGLSATESESIALTLGIGACHRGEVPSLPGVLRYEVPPSSSPEPESCCKVCRAGQACGDSCISESKSCTKPPGCACDE